jgi:hypothetical protein
MPLHRGLNERSKMKLGRTQQIILNRVSKDSFHNGCGWIWTNYSSTVKILESLVKHGLVEKSFMGNMPVYKSIQK